jgi:hypothetical protein
LKNIFKNNNWERYKIENLTSLITKGSSPNWQGANYVENSGSNIAVRPIEAPTILVRTSPFFNIEVF